MGVLSIGKEHLNELTNFGNDLGVSMRLNDYDGISFGFKKANFPTAGFTTPYAYDELTEEHSHVKFTLLGNGLLKVTLPAMYWVPQVSGLKMKGQGEITFIGVRTQTHAQVRHETRQAMDDWRDCKYTGQFHPDNWGFGPGLVDTDEDTDEGTEEESEEGSEEGSEDGSEEGTENSNEDDSDEGSEGSWESNDGDVP